MQLYCRIKEKRLLKPDFTRFTYLIHSFRSLLDNKPEIEYIYGIMSGIHDNIQARSHSLVDWEVIQIIATRMKGIIDSIILNQCFVNE